MQSNVDADYSNTVFYKISSKDAAITDVYIGHATNFVRRKTAHKQGCNNPKSADYKLKVHDVMRHYGGWDNWQFDIIAFHECIDQSDALAKEKEYIVSYNATLN
jgi:predicted GIY-YIG superfamily endonuclease